MQFIEFAEERMRIYLRRLLNIEPWTTQEVFLTHRFTNTYRVLDRTTQYLIKYVQDGRWEDAVYKTYLFKTFNKIETWERLVAEFGEIVYADIDRHTEFLNRQTGLWSSAYMMTGSNMSTPKSKWYLMEIKKQMRDDLAGRLASCNNLKEIYDEFLGCQYIADFLAYQYATDINYMMQFPEGDFCRLGPGSRRGLEIVYGKADISIIFKLFENQGKNILFFRPLQPIDIQNCFCEISKAQKERPRRGYLKGGSIESPVFPDTWEVDFDEYLRRVRGSL